MPLFCLPPTPNPVRAVSKADKKRDKCLIFVYRLVQIQGAQTRKQTKNGGNVSFLSTGLSKFWARGIESRQKMGEMSLFCLPDSPKLGRATSKADKKRGKCLFFVYHRSKSGPRGLESITKSSKIEKIFYSVPSSKRPSCNQCSQSDSKTDKTRQKTMPKLSLRPQSRNDSADKPRSVVGICPHPGCKHIPIGSSSRLFWNAHYLMFSH